LDIFKKSRNKSVYNREIKPKSIIRFSQKKKSSIDKKLTFRSRKKHFSESKKTMVDFKMKQRKQKSVYNFENFESAYNFFKEKNQVFRNQHYDDECNLVINLDSLPLEKKFVDLLLQNVRESWKNDQTLVKNFLIYVKQIYIFNSKLIENYFETKFNSILHKKNKIKSKHRFLKKLKGEILKKYYYSDSLERNNYKSIITKIQAFDDEEVDFNICDNLNLRNYDQKTLLIFHYAKKLSQVEKKLDN
jgi:hypothetical protein